MKKSLPAPPQPSFATKPSRFADGAPHAFRPNSQPASTREALARHNAAFLENTFSRALFLGALVAMSGSAVVSGAFGLSVGIGVALSLALLKSQQILVTRATRHLDDARVRREYSQMTLQDKIFAAAPLLAIGMGKYAVVGALVALALAQGWFSLGGFLLGFTLLHVVLAARAFGVVLAERVRPVREVYARKSRRNFPSTHGF